MRSCLVGMRAGLIVAQNGKKGVPATEVFVLFNGDDVNESSADWFPIHSVLPTGVVDGSF